MRDGMGGNSVEGLNRQATFTKSSKEISDEIGIALQKFNVFLKNEGVPERDTWVVNECVRYNSDNSGLGYAILEWLKKSEVEQKQIYDTKIKPNIIKIYPYIVMKGGKLSSYWIKEIMQLDSRSFLFLMVEQCRGLSRLLNNKEEDTGLTDAENNELVGEVYNYFCNMEKREGLKVIASYMGGFANYEMTGGYDDILEYLLKGLEEGDPGEYVNGADVYDTMGRIIRRYRRHKEFKEANLNRLYNLAEKFKGIYEDAFRFDVIKDELRNPGTQFNPELY